MSTSGRVIACIVVAFILSLIWLAIFGKLSATPIVIGITICALVTQENRSDRYE